MQWPWSSASVEPAVAYTLIGISAWWANGGVVSSPVMTDRVATMTVCRRTPAPRECIIDSDTFGRTKEASHDYCLCGMEQCSLRRREPYEVEGGHYFPPEVAAPRASIEARPCDMPWKGLARTTSSWTAMVG